MASFPARGRFVQWRSGSGGGPAQIERKRNSDFVALVTLNAVRHPRFEHDKPARLRRVSDFGHGKEGFPRRMGEGAMGATRPDRVREDQVSAFLRRVDVIGGGKKAAVVRVLRLLSPRAENIDPRALDLQRDRLASEAFYKGISGAQHRFLQLAQLL